MDISRRLDLTHVTKSLFLLRPRQTGKTWLLRHQQPEAPCYYFLHAETFLRLSTRPGSLREGLLTSKPTGPVIIDEIQKLPILLDDIQAMIYELGLRLVLTGSSARKLKHSGELVEPWKRGAKRKAISTGRLRFFDRGVRNALAGERGIAEGLWAGKV